MSSILAYYVLNGDSIGECEFPRRSILWLHLGYDYRRDRGSQAVITHMKYNFNNRSYIVYDYCGGMTQKQTVLDNASRMGQIFDYAAVFYHGHGGFHPNYPNRHRDLSDDDGLYHPDDQIWDYEIYEKTRSNKHFFVML